jgi:hypothetical protein
MTAPRPLGVVEVVPSQLAGVRILVPFIAIIDGGGAVARVARVYD